jgi:FtsP/CotA-like multicopper oxidase with cupredoxin domain
MVRIDQCQIGLSGWTGANSWLRWAPWRWANARPGLGSAQRRPRVTLEAKAAVIAPGQNQPEIPIWALQSSPPDPVLRFGRGDELEIAMQNSLPVRTVLNWHGLMV